MSEPLLRVENLRTVLEGAGGAVRAVDGVDFEVCRAKPWRSWASPDPERA